MWCCVVRVIIVPCLEEPSDTVLAIDQPNDLHHAELGLAGDSARLRLNARHLERMVPAGQRAAQNAGGDLVANGQLRLGVVLRASDRLANRIGKALAVAACTVQRISNNTKKHYITADTTLYKVGN